MVAIFGPTDPARNGPYGTRSIVLRHAASVTSYAHHDRPDDALRSIPAAEVLRRSAAAAGEWHVASWSRIARRIRVPVGFVFAAFYLWLARPSWACLAAGASVVAMGVALRAYASGHVRKASELTTTGPYAHTRNPLYLGSLIIAAGFAMAARSLWIALALAVIFFAIYLPVIRLRRTVPAFTISRLRRVCSPRSPPAPELSSGGRHCAANFLWTCTGSIASTMRRWGRRQSWRS